MRIRVEKVNEPWGFCTGLQDTHWTCSPCDNDPRTTHWATHEKAMTWAGWPEVRAASYVEEALEARAG